MWVRDFFFLLPPFVERPVGEWVLVLQFATLVCSFYAWCIAYEPTSYQTRKKIDAPPPPPHTPEKSWVYEEEKLSAVVGESHASFHAPIPGACYRTFDQWRRNDFLRIRRTGWYERISSKRRFGTKAGRRREGGGGGGERVKMLPRFH